MSAVGNGKVLRCISGRAIVVPPCRTRFQPGRFGLSEDHSTLITPFGPLFITHAFYDFFIRDGGITEEPQTEPVRYVRRQIGKPMTCAEALRHAVGEDGELPKLHTPLAHVFHLLQVQRDRPGIYFDDAGFSNYFYTRNMFETPVVLDVWWNDKQDRFGIDVVHSGFGGQVEFEAYDCIFHPELPAGTF